jgi:nucleoside-diphosphate-sugar epimerase
MKIFLAGASGVIGRQLIPLLVAEGHAVLGMTRTPANVPMLQALGAEPFVGDVYDRAALTDAMVRFAPQLVMHQLTDLPDDAARIPEHAAANSRIRREGTRNLLDAARAAGAARVVAQSVAWELPGEGGAAKHALEEAVLAAGGVVLRYGRLFGPGTYYEGDTRPEPPAVSVAEAARRTVALLEAPSGIVEVVDG